ncbi:MAG: AI-2E family transporter [Pseudomonadota bacterium]|jgi:AI-2 transport protein TqsA
MQASAVARISLVVIAVVTAGAALHWAAAIFTPLVLAVFLLILVDGFARALQRHAPWLPEWADLPLALVITLAAMALALVGVLNNAASFGQQLVTDAPKLNLMIGKLAAQLGVPAPPALQQVIQQVNPARYVGDIAGALQTIGSGAVYVFIYLGFLLASRQGFSTKAAGVWPDPDIRRRAVAVLARIRDGVQRYLWIQTVSGSMIALSAFALMLAVGLEHADFWAFLIFILVFIPVIGGLVAGVLPPLFALIQYNDIWPAVIVFVGLQVILFAIGTILLPRMQRDGLNIDPVVVLLSLAIWGSIWGIPGMFLSTPLTVMAIVILAQFPGARWIAVLLSGDGEPWSGAQADDA